MYLFEENSEYPLILIVLNLFLVLFDPCLILFESIFYLIHMLFIGVDKLSLLSFEHEVDLALQIRSEVIEIFHQLIDLFDMVLARSERTLYSKALI